MILLSMLIWITYSVFEGWREAHYWFHRTNSPYFDKVKNIDQHNLFVAQRAIPVFLLAYASFTLTGSIVLSIVTTVANALLFSFFHNGMMYTIRHWISREITPNHIIYPNKWFEQSTSSQAKLTFLMGPTSRTIQAILGLVLYIITSIL